jgi:polar amino acid transport system substrate-binding protein
MRVLGIGLLIAFVMANIVWLVERRHNPDFQKGYLRGIWDGLWYFFGIVSTGEYQIRPTQGFRRIITAAWWLLGVILIAQFTAVMTTTLTLDQLSGQIRGPEDLPGKRVATVEGSTAAQYLSDRSLGFVGVQGIEDAYRLLEEGQVDAVVYDAPVLAYYTATSGQGSVRLAGPIFQEEAYGIALPTNSLLREPINAALLRLRQDGTYEEIYRRWFVSAAD